VERWKDEDSPLIVANREYDVVVSTSYGTGEKELVKATCAIARRSVELAKKYRAALIYAPCSYLFEGAAEIEATLKEAMFAELGIKAYRANNMENTVQEAQAIAKFLREYGLRHQRILIVTGEMHSPSARWIWEHVIPGSQITITCVPYTYEYQLDQPVLVQRYPWIWFAANIARQTLLRTPFVGLRIGKRHHRAKVVQKG